MQFGSKRNYSPLKCAKSAQTRLDSLFAKSSIVFGIFSIKFLREKEYYITFILCKIVCPGVRGGKNISIF